MSVANGTTRFLAESANGGQTPPDGLGSDDPQGGSAPRAAPQPFIGSRVGAYLVTKWLGSGGVGEVYKGVDVMLKREVAIKVLRPELASDPLFLERFRREAQLHAKLSHPNVASVHAFLHEGDKQFMVMEYVPGISLEDFLRSGGPVPAERALGIFRRTLDGIDHAHGCGIVHRDIKPANIMLADNGQVKVMDFGIARALDCQEHLTRIGQVAGTAKTMSPEQIRGGQADVRSDIYSLGIVLYTLLAGRAPFDGKNDHALMIAQLEQAPPPLRALVDDVPLALEDAVMRALEKDPRARFQTVREFAAALDACAAELAAGSVPIRVRLDAETSSRTVINPVLRGAQRLPGGARGTGLRRMTAALRSVPRPGRRAGIAALALVALAATTVLAWPRLALLLAPATEPVRPVVAQARPVTEPPRPADASPSPQPAAAQVEREAAVPSPARPAQESGAASELQVAAPRPAENIAPVRSLSIVRLPSDDGAEGPAGNPDPGSDAAHRFKPGQRIRLLVAPSHEAHVYCYLEDETRHVVRFYPNRFSKGAPVKVGAALEIPGKMPFELQANHLRVTETIACFASERDVLDELPASVVGTDFANLPVASLDEVRRAFARITPEAPAQASFRVEPR